MTIEIKQGNVVDAVLSGECHFMLHITNGQQVAGSGVAKEVRERIPSAYTQYMKKPKNEPNISCSRCMRVVNLTAQQYYGYDGKRYLKYDWLVECLHEFVQHDFTFQDKFDSSLKIAIPFGMGAVRSGGDWEIISEILEGFLGHHKIIAYKL